MRFQVPQFIEVESKIFGPLTLKQFIYLLGGAGVIFLLYVVLPFWLMIIFALPVGAFSLALAFYKINNRPFIKVTESALKYFIADNLYLWKKKQRKSDVPQTKVVKETPPSLYVPKLTESKLKDLSWSLDIKDTLK